MKTERFYAATNRSDNLLHIETDGCIVNIQVGLRNRDGNPVTVVSVLPDDESRGGDGQGDVWHTVDADDNKTDGARVRVVRQRPDGSPLSAVLGGGA